MESDKNDISLTEKIDAKNLGSLGGEIEEDSSGVEDTGEFVDCTKKLDNVGQDLNVDDSDGGTNTNQKISEEKTINSNMREKLKKIAGYLQNEEADNEIKVITMLIQEKLNHVILQFYENSSNKFHLTVSPLPTVFYGEIVPKIVKNIVFLQFIELNKPFNFPVSDPDEKLNFLKFISFLHIELVPYNEELFYDGWIIIQNTKHCANGSTLNTINLVNPREGICYCFNDVSLSEKGVPTTRNSTSIKPPALSVIRFPDERAKIFKKCYEAISDIETKFKGYIEEINGSPPLIQKLKHQRRKFPLLEDIGTPNLFVKYESFEFEYKRKKKKKIVLVQETLYISILLDHHTYYGHYICDLHSKTNALQNYCFQIGEQADVDLLIKAFNKMMMMSSVGYFKLTHNMYREDVIISSLELNASTNMKLKESNTTGFESILNSIERVKQNNNSVVPMDTDQQTFEKPINDSVQVDTNTSKRKSNDFTEKSSDTPQRKKTSRKLIIKPSFFNDVQKTLKEWFSRKEMIEFFERRQNSATVN